MGHLFCNLSDVLCLENGFMCLCVCMSESHPAPGGMSISAGGMTLLAQLSNMPSMSALIDSPVPSVGSVVPNMHQHHLNPSLLMANGLTQQSTPEVIKHTHTCTNSAVMDLCSVVLGG